MQHETVARRPLAILIGMHLVAAGALLDVSRSALLGFLGGWILTGGLGISLGYHRLLSHRAFAARPWLARGLALLGVLAWQGGPLSWAARHRAHHRFADRNGDPHSAARGFWFAHVGWVVRKAPNGFRFRAARHDCPDLNQNLFLRRLERHELAINVAALVALFICCDVTTALWSGPLRIVAVWHLTWLVNSLGHGASPMVEDTAAAPPAPRNHRTLALFNFGESLHANHHATPAAANFARKSDGVDLGFALLKLLSLIGQVELRPCPTPPPQADGGVTIFFAPHSQPARAGLKEELAANCLPG